MDSLAEIYAKCLAEASKLDGFVPGKKNDVEYDIDVLANGYVKAKEEEDEALKSQYFCALVIRYWHMILYFYNKSPNIPLPTIINWVVDGILKAMKYHAWDSSPNLIGKRNGAEVCINRAIDNIRLNAYAMSNAEKRKGMFFDGVFVHIDGLPTREYESFMPYDERYPIDVDLVNMLLKRGRLLDAMVIDLIVNGSCATDGFSTKKLFNEIRTVKDNYFSYFARKYEVRDIKAFMESVSEVTNVDVRASMARLRNTMAIRDSLL